MKQQVSPAVIAVCIVAVLGIAIFFGIRALRPATAGGSSPAPLQTTKETINGQPVPANVPSYYWKEHQGGQGQPATPGP